MTTTITTRSRSSSRCLSRAKGGCANDGTSGDFVFDDEEINSVEAEGQSEKQLLTAALVTSTVELRGSGATVPDPTHTAMKGAPPPKPSAINSRITSAAKSVRRSPRKTPPSTANPVGSNMNPTLVPNPLAFHPPSTSSKGGGGTKKPSVQTSSLMSAAPQHAQPVPNPVPSLATSSGSGTGSHFGGQLATMAESAASQDFQSDGLATNEVVVPQARGRIFSIDLDPSVLDFVDPLMDSTKDRSGSDPSVGRVPYSRDRGFSFECFSFGISQDEPVPPVPTSSGVVPVAQGIRPRGDSIVSQGTRPRGDSIIYDPCSFGEGGIHEASALLHMKQGRGSSIDEGKPSSREAQNPDPPAPAEAKPASDESEPPRKEPYHAKTRSKAKYTPPTHPDPPKLPPPSSVSSFSPHPTRDDTDTKRMPRRDSAPAPSSTGVSQFSSSVPSEAFSTTHAATACPMELINKGGRIGIYLPEERKARIAKFHSKRKNRTWRKKIKYDCRKKLADGRPRIKGRFVKRSDVDP